MKYVYIIFFISVLPEEDPVISGMQMEYQIGDEINLNCTSGKSHPASQLHWYINEQQVSFINIEIDRDSVRLCYSLFPIINLIDFVIF